MKLRLPTLVACSLLVGCSDDVSRAESGAGAEWSVANDDDAAAAADSGDPWGATDEEQQDTSPGSGDDSTLEQDPDDSDDGAPESGAVPVGLWPRDLLLRDEDGDGVWRAGEQAQLQVDLYNAGDEAYRELPGLRLGIEDDSVIAPETEVWAWSVAPGESARLSFWLVASPTLASETTVELTVAVVSQGCGPDAHPCPDPNPARIAVTIQP